MLPKLFAFFAAAFLADGSPGVEPGNAKNDRSENPPSTAPSDVSGSTLQTKEEEVPIPAPSTPVIQNVEIPQPQQPAEGGQYIKQNKNQPRIEYEGSLQKRLATAAEEISAIKSKSKYVKDKSKNLVNYLRTAAGNRSIARTKLKQLMNAPDTDWTRFKLGAEQALTDLESAVSRAREQLAAQPQ